VLQFVLIGKIRGDNMADENTKFDADGYYGEEEIDNQDIDMSFLDEDKDGSK
jgi:hypothetical protein